MRRNPNRREFLAAAAAGLAPLACNRDASPAAALRLRYDRPATEWVEALPVGNGRLGAMVFGGVSAERIQFNEDTVWQGEPHDYAHAGAHRYLERIRRLLAEGKQAEAEQLAMDEFMSVPLRQKAYQAFADLTLEFSGIDAAQTANYERALSLDDAVASVSFDAGGAAYAREVFASYPAQAIVVRLTASSSGRLNFAAGFQSAHETSAVGESGGDLTLSGAVADSAIRFEARLAAATDGGSEIAGGKLVVRDAGQATLLLAGGHQFRQLPRCLRRSVRPQRRAPSPPFAANRTSNSRPTISPITGIFSAASRSTWGAPPPPTCRPIGASNASPPPPTPNWSRCCSNTAVTC